MMTGITVNTRLWTPSQWQEQLTRAEPGCDIALIRLAVISQNLILNMNDHGFKACGYNRTTEKVLDFLTNDAKGVYSSGTSYTILRNISLNNFSFYVATALATEWFNYPLILLYSCHYTKTYDVASGQSAKQRYVPTLDIWCSDSLTGSVPEL